MTEDDDVVIGVVRMYDKVAFKAIDENIEEYIMGYEL